MTKITVDTAAPGPDLDMGRFVCIGQAGWTDRPIPVEHTESLRNLKMKFIRLFVQEYFHVHPRRGVYEWGRLDKAIEAVLACGAKPVMCICIKPKVLFPDANERSVHPRSYAEWRRLIRAMVRHCNVEKKHGIEYWEVGNEPDIGGGGGCPYLFTPEDYPVYYEQTVRAIRKADPAAKVGGPAIARSFSTPPSPAHPQGVAASPILPALLDRVVKKKLPLDFVSWHRYSDDPEEFRKSIRYVHGLLAERGLKCETSLNEWNIGLRANMMMHLGHPEYQPCFVIDVVNAMIEEGLSNACYWHIRSLNIGMGGMDFLGATEKGVVYAANYNSNLLAVFDSQGNARPVYYAFKMLSRLAGRRAAVGYSGGNARALAAYDAENDSVAVLVWNFAKAECRAEKVRLAIKVKRGVYSLCEYRLDAKCPGNTEDERLKTVRWVDYTPETEEFLETLELPPYGVAMLRLKFRGCPSKPAAQAPAARRGPDHNDVTAESTAVTTRKRAWPQSRAVNGRPSAVAARRKTRR